MFRSERPEVEEFDDGCFDISCHKIKTSRNHGFIMLRWEYLDHGWNDVHSSQPSALN